MRIVGIICEYNPLHLGHARQIRYLKERFEDCAVVCLMSGNFVQRGAPAILDKSLRAQAALAAGADLVLELPITYALSSAEGFAAGGVRILSGFCDGLCFGSESGDARALMAVARQLLSEEYTQSLRSQLEKGLSFPAARQAALGEMGSLVCRPNDILATEYCKAIIAQGSAMEPLPILRPGSYHDEVPDGDNPSATAVRKQMLEKQDWAPFVPENVRGIFDGAPVHTIANGEKAMLYRLRTMTDEEFEDLPYGSEGLWRKLMHASRGCAALEEILTATKSKRYTRTRLDRMVLCAFLGITKQMLATPAPYTRVLGFTDKGRNVLKKARQTGLFPNIGEKAADPYQILENRADDLYALFADTPEAPAQTGKRRVCYQTEQKPTE